MNAPNNPPEPHGAVLVSETGVELYQLIGRSGEAVLAMGGAIDKDGKKSGPSPFDLMASALGACTAMAIRAYAQHKELRMGRVQVNVVHLRPALDTGDVFERSIHIDGGFAADEREKLLQIAERCPVSKTLGRAAIIRTTIAPDLALAGAAPRLSD